MQKSFMIGSIKARTMGKTDLDLAIENMEKDRKLAGVHLDRQARVVQAIDRRMERLESQLEALEKEKQAELVKMLDFFDLAVVNHHSLPDGYTVSVDNKREIQIDDPAKFLKWMKENCEPQEVLEFFKDALKSTKLKSFITKQCNKQAVKGEIEPNVGGITIGDITFRRLTTHHQEKKK